jgi:hypothetical protein
MEENKNNKPTEVSTGTIGSFEKVMEILGKYGPIKTLYGIVMFVFFSIMVYVAANPGAVFERYDRYISEKHSASIDYRMESAPMIRTYLNQLSTEAGAERAYILEFHNGKSNPSGLQWQFGDLTFINDGTDDISDEIQNVSLSRYNFANVVHDNGYWMGGIDELISIDERFYNRMRLNGGQYFAFQMMYGSNMREIAILGITFMADEVDNIDKQKVQKIMHKYASSISPLLDEGNVKKK